MPVDWKNYVVSDPGILRGKLRLKQTLIPVAHVVGYLKAGKTEDEIIGELPDLTREQIAACVAYARSRAE
jgi:uncharacterized protein (DUF433 family)